MAPRIRATFRGILVRVFQQHGDEVLAEVVQREVEQEYDLPDDWRIQIPMGHAYNQLNDEGVRWQDLSQVELQKRVATEDKWWNALRYVARDFRDWGWMEDADGVMWRLSELGRQEIDAYDFTTLTDEERRVVFGDPVLVAEQELDELDNQAHKPDRVERSILNRRGQPAFRRALINAYQATCAITDCDALDALEAAHIMPVSEGGPDRVSNGLLLRADVHTLHDLGLLAIHPETLTVVLSQRLKNTVYGGLAGHRPTFPSGDDHPKPVYLRRRWKAFQKGGT